MNAPIPHRLVQPRAATNAKVRHECERCGLIAVLERAGRFRDADFYELWHDYHDLHRAYRLERRARLREARRLHDEIFRLEAGITWREGEIALLRAQLRAAGIEPMCGDE